MYCMPAQLADAKLAREVAQAATPERMRIPVDAAMDAVLRGTSTADIDPEDVAAAQAALTVIERALKSADALIDGYLRMRKPVAYRVPLAPVPEVVAVWAQWIARYLLHKERFGTEERTDPVVRDYKEAIRLLQEVRDGKFSLGEDDPLPPSSGGAPQFCGPERVFTASTLRDFGA